MSERSNLISKLQSDFRTRTAYIQAKVSTLVPSQIRALRLKSETPRQPDLAHEAEMHQSRISALETAGANPTLGTLSAIAAALKVGLKVEFVPFSEMLEWENQFSQDAFRVTSLDEDEAFLRPRAATIQPVATTAFAFRLRRPVSGRWRHPGTMNLGQARGDFSTIEGGNMKIVTPLESMISGAVNSTMPVMAVQQVPTT